MSVAPPFSEAERATVYRVIAERRDVRRGFLTQALPDEVLQRLLVAAHQAPSVGFMQPTRYVIIRDSAVRHAMHEAFTEANKTALETYLGERRERYAALKLEGLLEAPQHLCILSDTHSNRGHNLGRHTAPETALFSTVCAVQNLWLAARAEGIGVGWVSILNPQSVSKILCVPAHITPVAYLCLGYVDQFATQPDLERFGWESRISLEGLVFQDRYNNLLEQGGKL